MTTRIHIFCGPSLSPELGRTLLPEATFAGPARRGDVYLAEQRGAKIVGLIDGYFDHTLSVWHKEVLWALARGVQVYGAASMGALRAAELAKHGMRGVGRIFEQFRAGAIEDDDEVAMVHEPAEHGYRAQSDAMVNLRATLEVARKSDVVSADSERILVDELKQMYYPARSLAALKRIAATRLDAREADTLCRWLDLHGTVNQKQQDGVEMLACIAADLRAGVASEPQQASWRFVETDAWRTLRSKMDRQGSASAATSGAHPQPGTAGPEVVTWLERQDPELVARVTRLAAERALALLLAKGGTFPEGPLVQAESESFRRERRLFTPEQTGEWLQKQGLDVAGFSQLMVDNVLFKRFAIDVHALILEQIPNALRLLDAYETFTSRN